MTGRELAAELCCRNREFASAGKHPHLLSAGEVVLYQPAEGDTTHGNFYPAAWRAMQARPDWRKRLDKIHAQAQRGVRGADGLRPERRVRELDSCTSSDALLMNVFCTPGVLRCRETAWLLGVEPGMDVRFGVPGRVPLSRGHADTTEIDLRIGDLYIEANLTETDFQRGCVSAAAHGRAARRTPALDQYCDFDEVFDRDALPVRDGELRCYQLCRNVLAVHAHGGRFCALVDARRTDLLEMVHAVQRAIRLFELRTRVTVLTWQELSSSLPSGLRRWLDGKYGIAECLPTCAAMPRASSQAGATIHNRART